MTAMRARMRKEIEMLEADPPYGVSAWPLENRLDRLEAQIIGPEGSPYEHGTFKLDIEVPERYPFEPPKVQFVTPIFHPNIDDAGRICLDTLKMQPKGSWMPSVNISTLLTTIRLLMAEPNADDGLMADITDLFKHNRELFNRKASDHTREHATNPTTTAAAPAPSTPATVQATNNDSEAKNSRGRPIAHDIQPTVAEKADASSSNAKRGRDEEDSFSGSDSSSESDFSDDDETTSTSKRRRL